MTGGCTGDTPQVDVESKPAELARDVHGDKMNAQHVIQRIVAKDLPGQFHNFIDPVPAERFEEAAVFVIGQAGQFIPGQKMEGVAADEVIAPEGLKVVRQRRIDFQ
ncbi:hypothetical protein SDC9_192224 [bioreactor metagenome]|uniref:Uncharacterized protein n=1 Tax=bioreactor metagenome TaxID=1076179 RepID=A0A645I2K9_9ZZZZ